MPVRATPTRPCFITLPHRHYTKKPRINAQKMENIVATFNFMKGEGIKIVNIDSTDIMQGNMKLTLGLIWTLIFNYQVRCKSFFILSF